MNCYVVKLDYSLAVQVNTQLKCDMGWVGLYVGKTWAVEKGGTRQEGSI